MLRILDVLLGQAGGEPWPIPWSTFGVILTLVAMAVGWLVKGLDRTNANQRRDFEAERAHHVEEVAALHRRIATLEGELDRLRKGEG